MPSITITSIQNQNGTLVFANTDTDVSILFNYLKSNRSIETFLEDYPKVNLSQVDDVLEYAEEKLKSSFQ